MHQDLPPILLIEADHDARLRHETALRAAGFAVRSIPAWAGPQTAQSGVIVIDLRSFQLLQAHPAVENSPSVVVIADTQQSGIQACLSGAEDWFPVHGDDAYLVKTVERALRS